MFLDLYMLPEYEIIPPDKAIFDICSISASFLCGIWTLKHLKRRQDTAYSRASVVQTMHMCYSEEIILLQLYLKAGLHSKLGEFLLTNFDSQILSGLRNNLFSPTKEHSTSDVGSSIVNTHNPHQKNFTINVILLCISFPSLDTIDYTISFDRVKTKITQAENSTYIRTGLRRNLQSLNLKGV